MPGEPGAWPLDEITRWKLAQAGTNAASSEYSAARLENVKIKNDRDRLKLLKEQGEVVDFEAVVRIFSRTIAQLQSFGKEIPDRVLDSLPQNLNAKTKARVLKSVRKSFESMFDGMSQAANTWADEVLEMDGDDDSGD